MFFVVSENTFEGMAVYEAGNNKKTDTPEHGSCARYSCYSKQKNELDTLGFEVQFLQLTLIFYSVIFT